MTGGADQDHGDTDRVDTPQGSWVNIIQKIWRKDGHFEQKINPDGNLVSSSNLNGQTLTNFDIFLVLFLFKITILHRLSITISLVALFILRFLRDC